MVDWESLRHLAALAETGTLSAAARRLQVEHATIARRIAALEGELGVKLVDRRGRRLSLTPAGAAIAGVAARMETEAFTVDRLVLAARAELAGEVTISAPPALAAAVLMRPLAALQAAHPALRLTVVGEYRSASLERREADVAVRLSRPTAGALTIVRLGTMAFRFHATPAYLAATPPEAWCFLGHDAAMAEAPQQAHLVAFAAGRPIVLRASTAEIQQTAARAGLGIAILPDFLAETDPLLVRVPEQGPPCLRDVWLVVHDDVKAAPAVRAVMEALKAAGAAMSAQA